MKKNQQLDVKIEKLAYGGKGIARMENRVLFVDGGLPGDEATILIKKIKSNYVNAKIIHLIKPSPIRQPPACSHFGSCGGCKWQNLDYTRQCRFKREQVIESFQRIADVNPSIVHPTIPSPLVYGYRNKMEFSFTNNCWLTPEELRNPDIKKEFALGLHVPGSFDRIMHIQKCWLQDEMMNRILNFAQDYFKESDLPVFNLMTHKGLLRFLVLRKSFFQENYMVNIVTYKPAEKELSEFTNVLTQNYPKIGSVINTVNPRFAQIAFGEEEHVLYGSQSITEKLGDYEFDISANSFFQTNPLQALNLYRIIQKYTGENNNLIWDLFAGTGTIALFLSKSAIRIVGFELVESAVKDAYKNCAKNSIINCKFVSGDIRKSISKQYDHPEIIVCDPPRAGMHAEVVAAIIDQKPKKIIYVSCNPTTLARDIKLMANYYELKEVQPVDMFPHTYHIESVAYLERS